MGDGSGGYGDNDSATLQVHFTPELAECFRLQDERLRARLQRERNQRQVWLRQQVKKVEKAVQTQRRLQEEISHCRHIAKAQRAQVEEIISSLRTLRRLSLKSPESPGSEKEAVEVVATASEEYGCRSSASDVTPHMLEVDRVAELPPGTPGTGSGPDGEEEADEKGGRISKRFSEIAERSSGLIRWLSGTSRPSEDSDKMGKRSSFTKRWDSTNSHQSHHDSPFEACVTSNVFSGICAVVIMSHAIFLGYVTQSEMNHAKANFQAGEPKPWPRDGRSAERAVSLSFSGFYLCEFLLKLAVFRDKIFKNSDKYWNAFDLFLLLPAAIDVFLNDPATSFAWARVLRLLRMLKMLRMIRVMRFFRELRIMMESILGSMRSIMWSTVLLLMAMYIFGLIFLQASVDHLTLTPAEDVSQELEDSMVKHWGTVVDAMTSLWMAITGGADWGDLADPLREAGIIYFLLFLFYIAYLNFAVLNALTGIFVDQAMRIASDRKELVEEQVQKEKRFVSSLQALFRNIDSSGNGFIKWSSFKRHLQDPEVKCYFEAMDLEVSDARRLFQILDMNGTGTIDLGEFIFGCTRIRGNAKSLDLLILMHDTKCYMRRLGLFMRYVENTFGQVQNLLDAAANGAPEPLHERLAKANVPLPPFDPADGSLSRQVEEKIAI